MKRKSRIAIIFDTDVDGVLSTVIALTGRYKHNTTIYPSSITELRKTIDNIKPQFNEMIILDIGLNPDDIDVIRAIGKHENYGTRCIWIDTHPSTPISLKKGNYRGIICFKPNVATATIVQQLYGTKRTVHFHKIARIMEKEIKVERKDKNLKEGNALAASIIGLSNMGQYIELIKEISSNPNTEIDKLKSVRKFIKKGQHKIDKARKWLRTSSPIRGEEKDGPAIWKTNNELLFQNVSGKALRTSAFKRQGVCLLLMPKSEYQGKIRFKVQAPDSDDTDWMSIILEVAEMFNGSGGGYERAFGGLIPVNQEENFVNKVWDLIQERYK